MKSSILQVVSCAALLALVALMGLVAKGTIQKPGATSAGDAMRSASLLRDRVLKSISYAGNNGRPGGAFPLGICEGDCDSDSDCAGSLRCFQRNGGESVPGCDGGASDGSRSDFCYDPTGGGPSPTPPSPTPPSPTFNGKSLSYAGNNGRPSGSFPLGNCQGDCDSDSDCAGSLRCFQRNGGESVPGCDGGSSDPSRNDFCYDPNGGGGGGPSPTPPSPSPPSPTPPASGRFNLKLYWEEGYFWQEERRERKWCMQCRDGCRIGKELKIVDCDGGRRGNPDNFRFLEHSGGEIQIQEDSSELCFERSGRDISLQRCDSGSSNQYWIATSGSFDGRRFQISPKNSRGDCATQRHHPKDGEVVALEPCSTAANDETSYWNRA